MPHDKNGRLLMTGDNARQVVKAGLLLIALLFLAGPAAVAADQAPRPPQGPPIDERVAALEKRVTDIEQRVFGLGTVAGSKTTSGVCRCGWCECAAGKTCADPLCPVVTKKAPETMPAAPAFSHRAAGLDFYSFRGHLWQVPAGCQPVWPDGATTAARTASHGFYFGGCAAGNCSGGVCYPVR
jgi:hypothetical protein